MLLLYPGELYRLLGASSLFDKMSSAGKTPAAKKSAAKKAVSHVHKFHIFVAVFLISMSHVSHHIIYLYKVVPIKFVSLEVSCLY
jgi:hypothetical protein